MNEVLAAAAHLPKTFVRLPPCRCQIIQYDGPPRLASFQWRHTCFQRLKHRVGDLAEDVELQLLGGAIADRHRCRVLVSGQPRDGQLRQPSLATDAEHDLDLARAARDRPNQPLAPPRRLLAPCPRPLVIAEIHESEEREGAISQPAITIIPVPYAAETLRK